MPRVLVTCAKGIAPFLKQELTRMGFPIVSETVAGIATEGTIEDTMLLNLRLRTGHRVLYLIGSFQAYDANGLYYELSKIPWEEYIDPGGYVCVTSSVDNPTIKDSRYANLKAKDAIVDRILAKRGRRPDSGHDKSGTVVNLYWKDDGCSVYFDTSGDSLSLRGYRKHTTMAPMQETLAAAVVMATGWSGAGDFINPMCGSGTLAIEAALLALNRAPGILRNNFGFMHVKGYNKRSWDALREQARKETLKTPGCRLIATDISREAIASARKNAAIAGVEHLIEFAVCDYTETTVPGNGGIVLLNPEYGKRMGDPAQLEGMYKGIGDFFKQRCSGYTGCVFTGNLDMAKKIGLKTKRRIPFFNGDIECRLLEYELYSGSRKPSPLPSPKGRGD